MARMAAWVAILSALVKVWPLPRAMRFVSTQAQRKASRVFPREDLATAVDAILEANLSVFKPICWKRAAILHRYLAIHGIESRINFGMRKEVDGTFSGHAWLEKDGAPIFEPTVPNYNVTFSFPADLKQTAYTFPLK
jgi:hypothetical protein